MRKTGTPSLIDSRVIVKEPLTVDAARSIARR